MQTRLIYFECSDRTLSEEWEARISVLEINAPSEQISRHLDFEAVMQGDAELEPILAPIRTTLGISAEEPGFACVRIAPHPGELTWAKGHLSIPEGIVTVAWERSEDQFLLDVSIPVGVHLKTVLPAHPQDALSVDDEPVDPDSQTVRTAHHVDLAVLPGSAYRFQVISPQPVR